MAILRVNFLWHEGGENVCAALSGAQSGREHKCSMALAALPQKVDEHGN